MVADRYRVVVVDDHAPTRMLLAKKFERRGWETRAADTIAEALKCLDPVPDCLVLDLNLADGHGETVLRTIRENNIAVKIVAVVTGASDALRLSEVVQFRPNLLIMKPFDWDILLRYCEKEITRR
jgi:DNA-binding response OmpR family regulator